MQDIKITNTLTGKKENLVPHQPGHIKIYACGVTVYDHCHIGHAMQAIYFDVIRNYLKFAGYNVTYVRNYTDVDDKIIKKANELGMKPLELSEKIIQSSIKDMEAIGVEPADVEPKVSETIDEIITMIETLVEKDAAYATADGDVYYRVQKKLDYGKLSNRKVSDLRSNTRDLVQGGKEDALDFALWKADLTEGASWDSPWGKGRPGWHIECSAMAKKHLGDTFDIHGGGRDLVSPHHENEIAQSESANSCTYCNYWIHSGLLTIEKQKMSKSLGNHILISDFTSKYPGEVLRLAYLQNHYSSNVDFSEAVFNTCLKKLLYFYETLQDLDAMAAKAQDKGDFVDGHNPTELVDMFHKEMSNDFSTVCALRDLHLTIKKANELKKVKKSANKAYTAKIYADVFRQLFSVFGLLKESPEVFIEGLKSKILVNIGLTENDIADAIQRRKDARAQKDFASSDRIRDEMLAKGIEFMDTPEGTKWTVRISEDND